MTRTLFPLLIIFLCGCDRKAALKTLPRPIPIPLVWSSSGTQYAETDSLAACRTADGVQVFATAKHGHRLDVFDGSTGRFVRSIGGEGSSPGQFRRPNGIITVMIAPDQPTLFVVERDNARVQVIHPQTGQSLATIGADILSRPYGAAVSYEDGGITLFVTEERVPEHKCVRVFRVGVENGNLTGKYLTSFGDSDGVGIICKPESIVFDPATRHLLVCDEDREQKNVKVYTPDGKFTGTIFGTGYVVGDPEGIVVIEGPGGGIVILTDQQTEITRWHLFRRGSYAYLRTLASKPLITNTDGICVFTEPFGPFKAGALFAVNNDADIAAYDLADFTSNASAPLPSSSPAP